MMLMLSGPCPFSAGVLLDALIVDGWDTLAVALRAHYEQTRPLPAHERWIAVTRAHRAWALEPLRNTW
jgi:hypothetical protein